MSAPSDEYAFDISQIFKRAFELSKTNNWTLVQGLLLIVITTIVVFSLFIISHDGGEGLSRLSEQTQIDPEQIMPTSYHTIFELVVTVILAPLWTGVAMCAIAHNRKQATSVFSILSYFRFLPILATASVLVSILVTFGFLLYIIPGLYLFMASTFTLPLIMDKGLNPFKALIASIKMVNKHLGKMLSIYLMFLAMFFLVIMSFGFVYLWVGPFYFNVKAILYQDLFCEVDTQPVNDTNHNANNGVFDA